MLSAGGDGGQGDTSSQVPEYPGKRLGCDASGSESAVTVPHWQVPRHSGLQTTVTSASQSWAPAAAALPVPLSCQPEWDNILINHHDQDRPLATFEDHDNNFPNSHSDLNKLTMAGPVQVLSPDELTKIKMY